MMKFTSEDKEIHLVRSAVKEVIIDTASDSATVVTEKKQYAVDVQTAKDIIRRCDDKSLDHLITAINNLTQMIRARVH